jgi:hypothetical protein
MTPITTSAAAAAVRRFSLLADLVDVADEHPSFETAAGVGRTVAVGGCGIGEGIARLSLGVYPCFVHSASPFLWAGSRGAPNLLRGHFLSYSLNIPPLHWMSKDDTLPLHKQSTKKEVTMVTRVMEIDGEKLRRLRIQKLWLIGDLAEKSGVHRNLISNYELGKSGAYPDTIRKLAKALDVDPTELLGE